MHCGVIHPSSTKVQRSNTEAMAATNSLQKAQPEPFLLSLLFLHFFLLFFLHFSFLPRNFKVHYALQYNG